MTIKIHTAKGEHCPMVYCDICGDVIGVLHEGAVVFDANTSHGDRRDVLHAHKGACHDAAEKRLGDAAGWQELGAHLMWLCHNLDIDEGKLAQLRKLHGSGIG